MSVAQAEAALAQAKAEEKYLEAKAAYQADPKKKAAFVEARDELVAARDEWRNNWRAPGDGAGDADAAPEPHSISLEVN